MTRRPFPDRAVAVQALLVAAVRVCQTVYAIPGLCSQARAAGWVARHLNHRRHQ